MGSKPRLAFALLLPLAALIAVAAQGQAVFGVSNVGDARRALAEAQEQGEGARTRAEKLEAEAARVGVVLDPRTLGGTGFHARRLPPEGIERLRDRMEAVHAGLLTPRLGQSLGGDLLAVSIGHYARDPHPIAGPSSAQGHARVVARARAYIVDHLEEPISLAALADAAATSERTLHRAFLSLLEEPPRSYIRRLRLHRVRHDLATEAEVACTVAIVANRWGIGELGRLAGWYRELFGELPSETLARRNRSDLAA